MRWQGAAARLLLCAWLGAASACGRGTAGTSPEPAPAPSPGTERQGTLPDIAGADREAQQQIRAAYDSVAAMLGDRGIDPARLGAAYGELGTLLMAAEFNDAAEPSLLNAVARVPGDPRWTYYLAHLYKRKGDLARSAEYLQRVIALQPGNVAASWWLGTVYLDLGRPVDAEAAYSRALALQPGALSAVYGLGRAALARNDLAKAAEYLERVLAMNQRALAAHYPLGLAYRGLGQLERAQTHLAQRSHMEILPIDPLMNELDALLHSPTAYQDRGMRASQSGNWDEAAQQFRRAVELSPDNVEARLDLSTALFHIGDPNGALAEAREAIRLAPNDPRAQSLLRTLLAGAP